MARRAYCPSCEEVVELPHRPGEECPSQPWQPENEDTPTPVHGPKFTGQRDDDGRPIGEAVKGGKRIPPTFKPVNTTDTTN